MLDTEFMRRVPCCLMSDMRPSCREWEIQPEIFNPLTRAPANLRLNCSQSRQAEADRTSDVE